MGPATSEITTFLRQWSDGDRSALDRLVPVVYDQLRLLAHDRLRDERPGHTLDSRALVHEAYLKLVDVHQVRFQDRAHFLAMASRLMRRVLVDHARARNALKRGTGAVPLPLEEAQLVPDAATGVVEELEEALQRLEAVDERSARVVEHRYFGGLTLEETAEVLGVSLSTVKSDLRFARAWLAHELGDDGAAGP
jgi:RNA polymerase sigma-70 factor (ECF subfamily)